ncbi:HutD family protein [Collimonas sp.]|jgi:environmental stress-induced protein Ves|uniref:HutD family protein n=1 Tax=Collimonas sp. TaxID=1963772 RepID=UPI0037BF140C
MQLIRLDDLPATPWKNGGGVTRELYIYPTESSFETFVWRVSIAELARSGGFSSFAGVDRVITLLAGAGMQLVAADGAAVPLLPWQPHRFRGEEQIFARLDGATCHDFNLMLRRGAAAGDVMVWHGDQHLPEGCALLYCVHGGWEVVSDQGQQAMLAARQALVCGNIDDMAVPLALRSLHADSVLISIHINLQQESRHAAQPS